MSPPEAARPFGIVDVLRLKIVSGEYPEGAKLPGETALAGYLQASRSTVRRALVELSREGLVSAARGRGTFVRVRPDKRVIVIGDRPQHEDLLDAAYEPVRRGWTPLFPTRPPVVSPQQQPIERRGSSPVRDARIAGCDTTQAAVLGLDPKQPIVLRDQRWRHQENGYVIALSSFAPTSLFGLFAATSDAGDDGSSQGKGDIAVYPELIREHGPAAFGTSVRARMPSDRERGQLEMETGVPLLIVTRVMLDPSGRPLEATVVHVPADRFEVAHVSRRPILSL